jgi:hypothetical protein
VPRRVSLSIPRPPDEFEQGSAAAKWMAARELRLVMSWRVAGAKLLEPGEEIHNQMARL